MDHSNWTTGIDLGDRTSVCCAIDRASGEMFEDSFSMTEEGLKGYLAGFEPCLVVFEFGGQSRWVKPFVDASGFKALAVDPRQLKLITRSRHAHRHRLRDEPRPAQALQTKSECCSLPRPQPSTVRVGLDQEALGRPKAGDEFARRLLVQAAHFLLGPFGEDCDLRRCGETLARRGGEAAKKRAAVAVARKLAVVMHRIWAGGSNYEPQRNAPQVA